MLLTRLKLKIASSSTVQNSPAIVLTKPAVRCSITCCHWHCDLYTPLALHRGHRPLLPGLRGHPAGQAGTVASSFTGLPQTADWSSGHSMAVCHMHALELRKHDAHRNSKARG